MCKFSILGLLVVRYFWRKKVYRALFFAKFGLNLKIVRYWLGGIKHTACRLNMRSMDIGQVIRKIVWGQLSNCWKVRGHLTGLNFQFEDKLNMRSKDNFLRLFWSLDKLKTIFEVGSKTEAESMEASKTKVKMNGGRRTSVPLGNLTQSDLRLPNWGCKPWSLKN